jgi:hypothetical protein
MHEKVPRTFYFIVSTPAGVAEDVIEVNFTTKHHTKRINANSNLNTNLPIFSSSASGWKWKNAVGFVVAFAVTTRVRLML